MNGYKIDNNPVTIEQLEELYNIYKHSVPSPVKYKYNYFIALPTDKLSLNQLVNGAKRTEAKENLEMTLLTGILNETLAWPGEDKHWFWQSNIDNDFVLLKKWFEKPLCKN